MFASITMVKARVRGGDIMGTWSRLWMWEEGPVRVSGATGSTALDGRSQTTRAGLWLMGPGHLGDPVPPLLPTILCHRRETSGLLGLVDPCLACT